VLVAHGFGGTKAAVDADARDLAARGFVVLTWTARGFGASGGQIALDAPDAEVADARKLVDWLATRPEVLQDGPGDPHLAHHDEERVPHAQIDEVERGLRAWLSAP